MIFDECNNNFSLSSSQSSLLQTKDESSLRIGQHLSNFAVTQLVMDDIHEDKLIAKPSSPHRQDFSFIHMNRIPSPLQGGFKYNAVQGVQGHQRITSQGITKNQEPLLQRHQIEGEHFVTEQDELLSLLTEEQEEDQRPRQHMQCTQNINKAGSKASDINATTNSALTYSESGQNLNGSVVWRLTTSANTLRGSIPFQSNTLHNGLTTNLPPQGQQHRTNTITSGSSLQIQDNDSLVFSQTTNSQAAKPNSHTNEYSLRDQNLQQSVHKEQIKQVTATFPQKLQLKSSEISFVCASDKENEGRLSNAIFRLPPEKDFLNQASVSERSSEVLSQKKLDFSRLSNSKYSLINANDLSRPKQQYYPLTQREERSKQNLENPFKDDPEKKIVLEQIKQKLKCKESSSDNILGLSEAELLFLTKTIQDVVGKKIKGSIPKSARPKTPIPLSGQHKAIDEKKSKQLNEVKQIQLKNFTRQSQISAVGSSDSLIKVAALKINKQIDSKSRAKALSVQSRQNSVSKEGCTGKVQTLKMKKIVQPADGCQSQRSVVSTQRNVPRISSKKKLIKPNLQSANTISNVVSIAAIKKKKLLTQESVPNLSYKQFLKQNVTGGEKKLNAIGYLVKAAKKPPVIDMDQLRNVATLVTAPVSSRQEPIQVCGEKRKKQVSRNILVKQSQSLKK